MLSVPDFLILKKRHCSREAIQSETGVSLQSVRMGEGDRVTMSTWRLRSITIPRPSNETTGVWCASGGIRRATVEVLGRMRGRKERECGQTGVRIIAGS